MNPPTTDAAAPEYGVYLPEGDVCYVCRWSPLGLLQDNVCARPGMSTSPWRTDHREPQLLIRRPSKDGDEEGNWHTTSWWPHLWWLRFLLGMRDQLIGTTRAPRVDWETLDLILSTWMSRTSVVQRDQFFGRPTLTSVLPLLRDVPVCYRSLRYLWRWATKYARHLLYPIVTSKDGDDACRYSLSRSLSLFTHVMRTQLQSPHAYTKTMGDIEALLMRRYGIPLFETECCDDRQEVLVPYSAHQHFHEDIRRARTIPRRSSRNAGGATVLRDELRHPGVPEHQLPDATGTGCHLAHVHLLDLSDAVSRSRRGDTAHHRGDFPGRRHPPTIRSLRPTPGVGPRVLRGIHRSTGDVAATFP